MDIRLSGWRTRPHDRLHGRELWELPAAEAEGLEP
jgi:hypothetical protein